MGKTKLLGYSTISRLISCLFLACTNIEAPAAEPVGQWIVVTPAAFRSALIPLVERRRAEGFDAIILQTSEVVTSEQLANGDGTPLLERIQSLVQQNKGRSYVLLAGVMKGIDEHTTVPAVIGKAGRMKGKPSDLGYGCPDPTSMPTAAVGRFPARNLGELQSMVQKTLAFERDTQPAPWRNRLLLLLGNPGGGQLVEMFVEQTLRKNLALLHPVWEAQIMFNASSSRYFLPPAEDRRTALDLLQAGNLFSVYLGHSGPEGMGIDAKFVTRERWETLNMPYGRGPFFTCGCFAFESDDTRGDGYGLTAMRNPAGPVAVVGAIGESYAAPGQLAAEGLLSSLAQPPFPTRLGDYWLSIQTGLARGKMDPGTFSLLDMADGSGGKVPLEMQRIEHLEMWMLLGDPALRLPIVPLDISLEAPDSVAATETLTVRGVLPERLVNAKVQVTLERPLYSSPADLERVPPATPENGESRLRIIRANFERANSFTLATAEVKSEGKSFAVSLQAPPALTWTNLTMRAYATVGNEAGLGVSTLRAKVAK